MKYSNFDDLDKMMIAIIEEGEEKMLREIEHETNPIKRFQLRNIYYQAIERLKQKREEI